MRKIVQSFIGSRNMKNICRPNYSICPVSAINFPSKIIKTPFTLTYRPQYNISSEPEVEVESKLIVPYKGYLKIRNS